MQHGAKKVGYASWTDKDLARYVPRSETVDGKEFAAASEQFARYILQGRLAWDGATHITDDLSWTARKPHDSGAWVAVPATPETDALIGAAEFAAMKDSAVLVNIARGAVVDQPALVAALQAKAIGGALLDVTTPEPLASDHPLWSLQNAQITMHLSGRAQSKMFTRSAERFVANCHRYVAGEPLAPLFDPARGY